MQMNGGGPFGLAGGQITDDSELAMCLMQGLINSNIDSPELPTINQDKIAEQYSNWMKSPPFDIGRTTRNALGALLDDPRA